MWRYYPVGYCNTSVVKSDMVLGGNLEIFSGISRVLMTLLSIRFQQFYCVSVSLLSGVVWSSERV